jgi:lysozyme
MIKTLLILSIAFFLYQEFKTPDLEAIKYTPQKREFAPINPIEKKEGNELLSLIKGFEGFRPSVYKCLAGVDTIGYGFTNPNLVSKGYMTEEEASNLLREEVNLHLSYVDSLVKEPLTENQRNALASFSFNCGKESLRKIAERINKGKYDEAAEALLLYVNASGKVSKGLQKRRKIEYQIFTNT